ncbi:unnamed protein product [Camellia sinensis]
MVSYLSQNWPVMHVAASKDGMYLAVAGLHGYELLFYPRYHLDHSSLLCRKPLLAKPMVMDVYQDYLLVTYHPFDVHIFHVKLSGELTPSSSPDLQIRELSIMTAKRHPAAMRFIPDQLSRKHVSKNQISTPSDLLGKEPVRANGELSLLDLDDGRERELTDSVEVFWVTCGQSEEKTNLIEEVSWLDYGHRGMQVSTLFKQEDFLQLDPELEFDREVYPLGLLPNAGVVVGVSQRMSFSACTEFPCFEPTPQAQTILHCLLRHLLQRDKSEEALLLAQLSAQKLHFSHCLEWLLFTVFEAEISRGSYLQSANKNQVFVPKHGTNSSLLEKTCDLIKNFPEYFDVVVSVARKTDGRHWADLFSAARRSTELFEECFQQRWYRTAACYILVIAKLEGPAVSQYCDLRLLQAALDESLYELAGELVQVLIQLYASFSEMVRFLLRSGREYEPSATDSDKLSPRFLSYFLFPSSYRRQSFDLKSPSFKEQNAHVASVKNILESHASYLMSGKELSKLVAFVKGTQFDLVEYLQRERYGSARLENFASGLELIGQKNSFILDFFPKNATVILKQRRAWKKCLSTIIKPSQTKPSQALSPNKEISEARNDALKISNDRQALCAKLLTCETERNELQQIYSTYEEKIETLEMSQVALEELMIKKEEELKCAMATIGLWNRGSKTLDNIIGSQQICSDKSGIGFGGKKEQKQSTSTSHDTRTQGKGEQKIQHEDGLLKLPRVSKAKEKKRVSHRDGRNSNISWGRRHFIGGNEVKGHIRPHYFDLLENKHEQRLCFPRPKNRKLKTKSRQVLIAGEENHNVKTPPKNCNAHNFVYTKAVW